MANEVRATFLMESTNAVRPVGWSETLWLAAPIGDLLTALTDATQLALARANLLGPGYQVRAVRVSHEGVFRDSRLEELNMPGKLLPSAPAGDEGDFASSAVLLRMEADDLNRRSMFISGAPDFLQKIDHDIDDPQWMAFFNTWKGLIITKWAYFGLQKQANGHPVDPPVKQLYPIKRVIIREYSTHKRGRPFDLYRGRKAKKKEPAPALLSTPAAAFSSSPVPVLPSGLGSSTTPPR